MFDVPFRSIAVSTCAVLTLAACEEGALVSPPSETTEDGRVIVQEARTVMQEVERADIFSTRELALWDGRPSLGGMWVAHPDVTDAERVRITNTVNGQVISAALFRRERLNPGPRIQLSSDAAAALDILAGQPTELDVVVLRQEEVVIEPAILAEPEPIEAREETVPDEDAPADGSDAGAVAGVAAGAAVAATEIEIEPERGFWARFRDSLRNDPAPKDVVTEPALTDPVPEVADSATVPSVETAPLDTVAVAAAAIAAAEAEEPQAPDANEPAPTQTALRNPFIQIGLFGEQANASAAAASLRQAGIVPTVSEGANDNGPFWRILVGPLGTANDQAELLAQVKSLGYSDAFLTSN